MKWGFLPVPELSLPQTQSGNSAPPHVCEFLLAAPSDSDACLPATLVTLWPFSFPCSLYIILPLVFLLCGDIITSHLFSLSIHLSFSFGVERRNLPFPFYLVNETDSRQWIVLRQDMDKTWPEQWHGRSAAVRMAAHSENPSVMVRISLETV